MLIMFDVEADGPIPADYSMIWFAAVVCKDPGKQFTARLKPVSDKFIVEALQVSGLTREDTLSFDEPAAVMERFLRWIDSVKPEKERLFFISDNNGFDWQFINWYLHHFTGKNPFGHSSTNLGSLYKGMQKDFFKNFKHLRDTKHTHNPLDDAMGNVEALLKMKKELGLKIKL